MTPEGYRAVLEEAWAAHLAPRAPDAPTVVSLFAGGGGSSLGYSMAGYRELLAADFDAHACATLRANFPHVAVHQGDVGELTAEAVMERVGLRPGELDVLDGSPPCQGFSTTGKRRFGDGRNLMYRHYVRLLAGLRPRALVVENVVGLVHGKMRLVFADMLAALTGCGYRVSARVLNAMHYGVPQSRARVIFVGVREDLGVPPSHPPATTARPLTVRDVLDLRAVPPDAAECPSLRDQYGRLWRRVPQGRGAKHALGWKKNAASNCYKLTPGKPSPTIPKTQVGTGYATLVHPTQERPIAVSEGRTLSSIPPGFILEGRYQERFARIGNCVPPLFMRAVAGHVRELLARAAGAAA